MKKIFAVLITLFLSVSLLFSQAVSIRIDPSISYQTIEGFGASDCWVGNYVGQYWNEDVKSLIGEYLFSQELKYDGTPSGIGLSIWRVNLGGGTIEQGDASNITDMARRAECFLDANGNYDWTKSAGQQYFMRKAKEQGCGNFVGFSNSPLVIYTRNGKGFAIGDGNSNLQTDKYDSYATYLADVAKHFNDVGMPFTHISPINEPQYDWKADENGNAGQEGSPWQNSEIKKMVVALDKALVPKNIDTKIMIGEAGSWEYIYTSKGRASNQLYEFFDKRSSNYIGNLASLDPAMCAHSYWTHHNHDVLVSTRSKAANEAKRVGVKLHQTEWSLLSEANSSVGYPDSDASYMDNALFMAKIIYSDFVYAGVSSWSYWTSMGTEHYNHKNRFLLLALEPGIPGNLSNPITMSGTVYPRSTLWALGNYSRFIRPGYKRIKLAGAEGLNDLMATAYMSPDSSQIVAVYVNMTYDAKQIQTQFENTNATPLTNKRYITSSLYNLKKYGSASSDVYDPQKSLSIPSRSVMTVVYDLNKNTSDNNTVTAGNRISNIYPNPFFNHSDEALSLEIPDLSDEKEVLVSVSSLSGKIVFQKNIKPKGNILYIKELNRCMSAGSYLINVQSLNANYIGKFIVH